MVDIFKALSDETRLRILGVIWDGDLCVCEIVISLNLTQSNASRHLNVLRSAGVLTCTKQAQWAHFEISDEFKANNELLWEYLRQKLAVYPICLTDRERLRVIREKKLCEGFC